MHSDMINPKMTKSMSYYTPRMSRVNRWDKVVMFGVQMFCKTWLIDYFNENFFELSEEEVAVTAEEPTSNKPEEDIDLPPIEDEELPDFLKGEKDISTVSAD